MSSDKSDRRAANRVVPFSEMTTTARLLQLAVPLVKTHGFTRAALARAVLDLPQPHAEPLPDAAVTALFGRGDNARRTLVRAWLEDARGRMRRDAGTSALCMRDVLHARMRTNEPVLEHLPEVRCSPSNAPRPTRLTTGPRHSHCSRRRPAFCP